MRSFSAVKLEWRRCGPPIAGLKGCAKHKRGEQEWCPVNCMARWKELQRHGSDFSPELQQHRSCLVGERFFRFLWFMGRRVFDLSLALYNQRECSSHAG